MKEQQFIITSCNPGSEKDLKAELQLNAPDLHSAFAMPGIVTFKNCGRELPSDYILPSTFAQTFHLTTNKISGPDLPRFLNEQCAKNQVLSATVPSEAPSRAFAKIVEAEAHWQIKIAPNDTVLELGCAPGGISYALLLQGAKVIGVDRAQMAPIVKSHPSFTHLETTVHLLCKSDIPIATRWIISDLNLDHNLVLEQIERLLPFMPKLRAGIVTIKMGDKFKIKDIAQIRGKTISLGFKRCFSFQLPANKKEFTIYFDKN